MDINIINYHCIYHCDNIYSYSYSYSITTTSTPTPTLTTTTNNLNKLITLLWININSISHNLIFVLRKFFIYDWLIDWLCYHAHHISICFLYTVIQLKHTSESNVSNLSNLLIQHSCRDLTLKPRSRPGARPRAERVSRDGALQGKVFLLGRR